MKILTRCPACKGKLSTKTLFCTDCGLELSNDFELSNFDYLDDDDMTFLITFLKARGNLSELQDMLNISYPTAKNRLEQVIRNLGIEEDAITQNAKEIAESAEMTTGEKPSDIIRNKLIAAGGSINIPQYNGDLCEFYLCDGGTAFGSPKLPQFTFDFSVFDIVVDFLRREGGKARKGMGRGPHDKVGSKNCDEHTVMGVIAMEYWGKQAGESTFDPVFAIAAMLSWAEIADNARGYLQLKREFVRG